MTPQQWNEIRDYADRVVVTVRVVDGPDDQDASEDWVIVSNGAAWERDWLVTEVESIALNGRAREQEEAAEYFVEISERRLSWGADVAVFEILLGIATWAATSAAWDQTKTIASKMYSSLTGNSQPARRMPTDAEAVDRATWTIAIRYNETRGDLTLQSAQVDSSGAARVVLESSAWTYDCSLELVAGDVLTASRIKRTRL